MSLKKKASKSIAIALVGVSMITPILNTVSAMEPPKGASNEMITPRYSSSTEDWRLVSSSQKLISNKYSHLLETTSTTAFNAGYTFKGFTVGASQTYSKSRKFKVYNRTRDITMKFKVYTRMGHFLRYETVKKRITTKHHVSI
ncbi:Uncharacterised protein [[Clostridium] sordellii]|uniref:hypothetical protein n=1 Tax=Paraclostridium sordellii TaxID=1505 RepID=UPI0005E4AA13|nr:hypothetical protein [Paeniclostridium sordellii]CEP45900.1 Uncharacterised protein [[Clostridium] sordellii] [Paeniclostridium sordellii]